MAKATRVKVETNILLELTPEEALTLSTVCGAIGGGPKGRRKHTSAIGEVLSSLGIHSLGCGAYEGQIDFEP